jgi:hypothetical protein
MLIYQIIFVFLASCYLIDSFKIDNFKIILILLVALCLITLAGFRDGIGTDYINYVDAFSSVSPLDKLSGSDFVFEPLVIMIVSTSKFIFGDGDFAVSMSFFCISLITILSFLKAISNFDSVKSEILGVVFFYFCFMYFQFTFNTIRHGLCVSLSWLAISYYFKKRNLASLFCWFLALSSHYVAIVFMLFFFVAKRKYHCITHIIFLCIGVLFYIFNGIEIAFNILGPFISKVPALNYYIFNLPKEAYGLSFGFIMYFVIYLYALFQYKSVVANDELRLFINIMAASLSVYLIFNQYYVLIERLVTFCNISFLIFMVYSIKFFKDDVLNNLLYKTVLIILSLIVFLKIIYSPGYDVKYQFIPYVSHLKFFN